MGFQANTPSELEMRLQGYSLLTAEILYWMPDHRDLLQSFVWQTLDIAPRFPRLHQFLDYWRLNIDAPLHSVRLAHASLISPAEMRYVSGELKLN